MYNVYIKRMLITPITEQARQHKWDTTCTIAMNNGFPITDHPKFREQKDQNTKDKKHPHTNTNKEMDHVYVS